MPMFKDDTKTVTNRILDQLNEEKDIVRPEDTMTVEERRFNDSYLDKLYTPTAIQKRLNEIEKKMGKGIIARGSKKLNDLISNHRNEFVVFFLLFVLGWVAINSTVVHDFLLGVNLEVLHPYLQFDMFPYKLLTLFLGVTGTILAQIILIFQKRNEEVQKVKQEIVFHMIANQELRMKSVENRLDTIQKENRTLCKVHKDIIKMVEVITDLQKEDSDRLKSIDETLKKIIESHTNKS